MSDVSQSELMVIVAARELKDRESVLVGVGIPNLAANLAKKLQAPNLLLVYESGAVGSNPSRMPLSIGDPCLVSGAKSVCSMYEQFAYYLQGGRIDVGFLGGAQIDKYGNINSTIIGTYKTPKVRLPGSGGACD
ncbi:MAG: CoA-transferase subunit beta, partial [Thermoplasmata archaeon]|nr:CoA-transferase subunit beta [Thermoplasmata archaeon]